MGGRCIEEVLAGTGTRHARVGGIILARAARIYTSLHTKH